MEKIIVHAKFHTGHRQLGYPGKCKYVHGHTWRGTVTISAEEFPRDDLDMSLDFGDIKDAFAPVLVRLDHYFLNEIEGLENPTSENIARWIWNRLKPVLPGLALVVLHETCTARCEYRGS